MLVLTPANKQGLCVYRRSNRIGQVWEALLKSTSAQNEWQTGKWGAAALTWVLVMPASHPQVSHPDQLLSSFVGSSSRVKLLFCLIFLANLNIQAIFCLLFLFAIPFCEGIVLFFASGLRTNLSFYYYFMFYTCLNSMCPLVSVFKLHVFLQKSLFLYTRNPKFLSSDFLQKKHN